MSNYLKNGLRQVKLAEKKKTKAHIKKFYEIINQINNIAKDLDQSLEYTEDNINDYTRHILGRELDSTEKFLLLSKLQNAKETTNNN